MFLRFGRLVKVSVLSGFKKEAALVSEWKDIVSGKTFFRESDEFEYDKDNFLYFRCRAIEPGPNGNGDYFPPDEIRRAYKTFVGRPFCIEHDSDTIDKARGVILAAELHDDNKLPYVECLVAVDKVEFPEIARQLELGILNSVSMGCSCSEAECSICGNVAHDIDELCVHMREGGVKGKTVEGNLVYEINRDLTFVELSGVRSPAFKDAKVFEVLAGKLNEKLTKEFQRYCSMTEGKVQAKKEEEMAQPEVGAVKNNPTSKLRQLVKVIMGELKSEIVQEEKIVEEPTIIKAKEENTDKFKLAFEKGRVWLLIDGSFIATENGRTVRVLASDIIPPNVQQMMKQGGTRTISPDEAIVSIIKECGESLSGFEKWIEKEKAAMIMKEPESIDKVEKESAVKATETKKEESENMFTLSYEKGDNLGTSYFVATDGAKTIKATASEVIPVNLHDRMLRDDKGVISPEEAIVEITKECGSTVDGFEKWTGAEKVKNEKLASIIAKKKEIMEKIRKKKVTRKSMRNRPPISVLKRRQAGNMIQQENASFKDEESVEKGAEAAQRTDQVAQDVKEQKDGWTPPSGSEGSAVKQYYSKLGTPSGGTVVPQDTWAIKLSSLKKDLLKFKSQLDSKDKVIAAKDKTIADLQGKVGLLEKKAQLQEKAELINAIVAGLEFETEEEKNTLIDTLAQMDAEKLGVMAEVKSKTASKVKATAGSMGKRASMEEMPPMFPDNTTKSSVETLSDILESEVPKI